MLLIYGLLLKLPWFISPQVPLIEKSDGFLYNRILALIKPVFDEYSIIYSIITFILLYTQAVSFNRLLNNRRLMQKPNYLPAMSYLLITSFFTEWNILSAPLIINTLLIWVWAKMSNLYNDTQAKSTLFNIGFAIGITTFFYFPSLAFALLIIFALVITRPPKIAEWIIAALGIATPWYLLFAFLFLTNRLYSFQVPGIQVVYPVFTYDISQYIGVAIILIISIAGGFFVQLNLRRQLVQVRKTWGLTTLYLAIALFTPFINNTHNLQYWILATVPLSAFAACFFFYSSKRWLVVSVHWIMVAFVIYITYIKR